MRKIVFAILTTISGVLLLLGYRTSTGEPVLAATTATPQASTESGTASGSSGTASGSDATSGSDASSGTSSSEASATGDASASASTSGLADGTFLGDAVSTRYGDVQVQITVAGGQITAVDVPVSPSSNGRDQQINARAIPQLVSSTLAAQSASVDMVSGATYTSTGYAQSLQSALDEAAA